MTLIIITFCNLFVCNFNVKHEQWATIVHLQSFVQHTHAQCAFFWCKMQTNVGAGCFCSCGHLWVAYDLHYRNIDHAGSGARSWQRSLLVPFAARLYMDRARQMNFWFRLFDSTGGHGFEMHGISCILICRNGQKKKDCLRWMIVGANRWCYFCNASTTLIEFRVFWKL